MKNRIFKSYFLLMLVLSAFVSVESSGEGYGENSQEEEALFRKPDERYPIEPNEAPKGKKIIKRNYRSRNLC